AAGARAADEPLPRRSRLAERCRPGRASRERSQVAATGDVRQPAARRRGNVLPRPDRSLPAPRRRRRARRARDPARVSGEHRRGAEMRLIVLLTLAVALVGCPPRHVVRHGVVDEDALAPIRRDLPLARGLSFTATVPARALDREEIATTVHTI